MQGSPARPTDRHHRVSDVLEGKPRWPNHGPQPTRYVLRVTGFVLAPLLVAVAIGPSIVPVGDVEDLTAGQLRDWSVASVNIAVASDISLRPCPRGSRAPSTSSSRASHPCPSRLSRLAQQWRDHGAPVTTGQFPAGLNLPHDTVDPAQPSADVAVTHPCPVAAWPAKRSAHPSNQHRRQHL